MLNNFIRKSWTSNGNDDTLNFDDIVAVHILFLVQMNQFFEYIKTLKMDQFNYSISYLLWYIVLLQIISFYELLKMKNDVLMIVNVFYKNFVMYLDYLMMVNLNLYVLLEIVLVIYFVLVFDLVEYLMIELDFDLNQFVVYFVIANVNIVKE